MSEPTPPRWPGGGLSRRRRRRRREPPARPLCVLLLPQKLDAMPGRERVADLLSAPGTVAVEPAPLGYGPVGRLPELVRDAIAAGQARRMELPGRPRVVVAFEARQYDLARALLAEHSEAELWYAAGEAPPRWSDAHEAALQRAALVFDRAAEGPPRELNRPLWERMEALGVESGRLGSER